jgi:hypothetical protein
MRLTREMSSSCAHTISSKPSRFSDLPLKFFGDGERWMKGRLSDRCGTRCLQLP